MRHQRTTALDYLWSLVTALIALSIALWLFAAIVRALAPFLLIAAIGAVAVALWVQHRRRWWT